MTVEALILIKTMPGKTRKVVTYLAEEDRKKRKGGRKVYREEGMKHVYRASDDYDVIAHVSKRNTNEVFELAERISAIKGSTVTAVSSTKVIFLAPKSCGDP